MGFRWVYNFDNNEIDELDWLLANQISLFIRRIEDYEKAGKDTKYYENKKQLYMGMLLELRGERQS